MKPLFSQQSGRGHRALSCQSLPSTPRSTSWDRALMAVCIFAGSTFPACAQWTNSPAAIPITASGSGFLAFIRVMGALAIVLALFFGGLWVARNWQRFVVRQGPAPKLTVCEVKALGQRHTLYVIGYEQQRMLVAASPAGVNLLTELPASVAEANEAAPAPAPMLGSRPNFGALLLRAIGAKS